jgi:hypothetical protein
MRSALAELKEALEDNFTPRGSRGFLCSKNSLLYRRSHCRLYSLAVRIHAPSPTTRRLHHRAGPRSHARASMMAATQDGMISPAARLQTRRGTHASGIHPCLRQQSKITDADFTTDMTRSISTEERLHAEATEPIPPAKHRASGKPRCLSGGCLFANGVRKYRLPQSSQFETRP